MSKPGGIVVLLFLPWANTKRQFDVLTKHYKSIPNISSWGNRGLLSGLNKYSEAIQCFDKVIETNPNDYKAWRYRGNDLSALGKFKEAIKNIREALKLTGDESEKQNLNVELLKTLLKVSENALKDNNVGNSKSNFEEALECMNNIEEEGTRMDAYRFFTNYFRGISIKSNSREIIELISILEKRKLRDIKEILEPFNIAATYWIKKNDPEILDRLNPEVREIVEKIIGSNMANKEN